jgi:hypothetical protein
LGARLGQPVTCGKRFPFRLQYRQQVADAVLEARNRQSFRAAGRALSVIAASLAASRISDLGWHFLGSKAKRMQSMKNDSKKNHLKQRG